MTPIPDMTAELAALMEDRLGIRGEGLEAKLRRAGRRLPRKVRRAAWALVEAERRAGHPRLARQIVPSEIEKAHARVKAHLQAIDPADRRWGQILGILAPLAFNLLLLFALILVTLSATGRL